MRFVKAHIIELGLVIAFIVFAAFLISANRDLRQANKQMKKENRDLAKENNSLKAMNDDLLKEVSKRDEIINKSTIIYDSLRFKLDELNNRNIITNYETYHTVTNLDLNGQIELLTRYITEADSIQR